MSAKDDKETRELTKAIATLPPETRQAVAEYLGNVMFDVDLAMEQVEDNETVKNALNGLYHVAKFIKILMQP